MMFLERHKHINNLSKLESTALTRKWFLTVNGKLIKPSSVIRWCFLTQWRPNHKVLAHDVFKNNHLAIKMNENEYSNERICKLWIACPFTFTHLSVCHTVSHKEHVFLSSCIFLLLFCYSTILKKMPQRKEAASEFQCWAISASTFGDKCGMAEGLRG